MLERTCCPGTEKDIEGKLVSLSFSSQARISTVRSAWLTDRRPCQCVSVSTYTTRKRGRFSQTPRSEVSASWEAGRRHVRSLLTTFSTLP